MDFSFLRALDYTDQDFWVNAPLAPLTWFKVGGPAACLLQPKNTARLPELLVHCSYEEIPIFFLGDGSNLLVSDSGFPGLVISTRSLAPQEVTINSEKYEHTFSAGSLVNDVVRVCCEHNHAGLQDFYGLPGTVGGAAFMNARCYEAEWSQIFVRAKVLLPNGQVRTVHKDSSQWDYKVSPFQGLGCLIEEVTVRLSEGPGSKELMNIARARYSDREAKGHFRAPCAGSMFKNNREFGQPSGKIIDSLGLRGFAVGGARVSPDHANIIINGGDATAKNIYDLTMHVQQKVKDAYGYHLEPEVVFLGNFED